MRSEIFMIFCGFMLLGILCNLFLFVREKHPKEKEKFLTSKRLLVFIVEILIAVIGFGLTITITNINEEDVETKKAREIIAQAIEYTENEIEEEGRYLEMYSQDMMGTVVYLNSSVTNLDYYNSVMSNDVIMQNVNVVAYGYFMDYLVRVRDTDERARALTDKSAIITEMTWRCQYLKKIRDLLDVCHDEMAGGISAEEAIIRCKAVNESDLGEYQLGKYD